MLIIENSEEFNEFFTMIYVFSAADDPNLLISNEEFNKQKEERKPQRYPAMVFFDESVPVVKISDLLFFNESNKIDEI